MKNKDELKMSLTLDDIEQLLNYLDAEPIRKGDIIISRTICHGGNSHKLYYYNNSHLFKCFTDCPEDFFDVFELIEKVHGCNLYDAVQFVLSYFGLSFNQDFLVERTELEDWKIFSKYEANNQVLNQKKISLREVDCPALLRLPQPRIIPWEKEGITKEVMDRHDICYDPSNEGIVIPHYDIAGNLIGVRERTLIEENEAYGKYLPASFNGVMYNHPLSFNLYNLNNSRDAIFTVGKAIVFESEKSCLLYSSIFEKYNDISVACCGSSLSSYQVDLLLNAGAQEIIVAFDKQYQQIGDDEFKKWTKKLKAIHEKYYTYATISFMFDKQGLLGYKDSPIDCGEDKFLQLYENRIFL